MFQIHCHLVSPLLNPKLSVGVNSGDYRVGGGAAGHRPRQPRALSPFQKSALCLLVCLIFCVSSRVGGTVPAMRRLWLCSLGCSSVF